MMCFAQNTKQIMHFRNPSHPSVSAVREEQVRVLSLKKEEGELMPDQNSPSRNSAKCCRDETPYHVPNHMKDSL